MFVTADNAKEGGSLIDSASLVNLANLSINPNDIENPRKPRRKKNASGSHKATPLGLNPTASLKSLDSQNEMNQNRRSIRNKSPILVKQEQI